MTLSRERNENSGTLDRRMLCYTDTQRITWADTGDADAASAAGSRPAIGNKGSRIVVSVFPGIINQNACNALCLTFILPPRTENSAVFRHKRCPYSVEQCGVNSLHSLLRMPPCRDGASVLDLSVRMRVSNSSSQQKGRIAIPCNCHPPSLYSAINLSAQAAPTTYATL